MCFFSSGSTFIPMNYYNEFDPKAAAWLRELIRSRLIPLGIVDDRSISDVTPADLRGFRQCHFFAGIGGWAYALQVAALFISAFLES
jgi:DNA (cytosine-5)-methyltransferase 1